MNIQRATSNSSGQPGANELAGTSFWIEEAEDLTRHPLAQAVLPPSDPPPLPSRGEAARNVWIEEAEDLSVQPSIPPTTSQQGSTVLPGQPSAIDPSTDPFAAIRLLLDQANRGEESLAMLRGWVFVRKLGSGGMGAVALIGQPRTDEQEPAEALALKVMRPEVAANPKAKDRFEREIEISKALKHPHIVPLRGWGCWQDVYFFTSDYCESDGVNDADQLRKQRGGKLSLQDALSITLQTLDALDYGHHAEVRVRLKDGSVVEGKGVVHRDVKPHNIFLSGAGSSRIARLGDYGVAKAFATAGLSGLSSARTVGGTIQFMPQQVLDDFKMAEPGVDVWSVAATLYYLLTGQPPRDFSKEPPERWLWVVSHTAPIPIRQRDSSISPKLAEVIDHALDDKDQLHFQSAAEFKRALEAVR